MLNLRQKKISLDTRSIIYQLCVFGQIILSLRVSVSFSPTERLGYFIPKMLTVYKIPCPYASNNAVTLWPERLRTQSFVVIIDDKVKSCDLQE